LVCCCSQLSYAAQEQPNSVGCDHIGKKGAMLFELGAILNGQAMYQVMKPQGYDSNAAKVVEAEFGTAFMVAGASLMTIGVMRRRMSQEANIITIALNPIPVAHAQSYPIPVVNAQPFRNDENV